MGFRFFLVAMTLQLHAKTSSIMMPNVFLENPFLHFGQLVESVWTCWNHKMERSDFFFCPNAL
jgi:hypothetical protein